MRKPPKAVLRLGGLALSVYLIALVVDFPAAVAFHFFGAPSPDVVVRGIHGTVWNGRAGPCRIGAFEIRHIDWSLDPWPLVEGTLALRFRITTPGAGSGTGTLLFKSLNRFRLEHVLATFDPAALTPASPDLRGTIELRLHDFGIRNGILSRLSGRLNARRISLQSPILMHLGPLSIQAQETPHAISVIHLTLGTTGDFTGRATITLTPGNGYQLDALIKPEPTAPALLERLLAGTGQPDPQGFYHLTFKGNLPPLSTLFATLAKTRGHPP